MTHQTFKVVQQKLHVCHTLLQSLATNRATKIWIRTSFISLFLCNLLRTWWTLIGRLLFTFSSLRIDQLSAVIIHVNSVLW